MTDIYSDYLDDTLIGGEHLENIVKRAAEAASQFWFDAIAFTGVSGALVAPQVAALLEKPLILVRKRESSHHSSRFVEGALNVDSYIIIDDFIDSGGTIERIKKEIKKCSPRMACVGVVQYTESRSRSWMNIVRYGDFYD